MKYKEWAALKYFQEPLDMLTPLQIFEIHVEDRVRERCQIYGTAPLFRTLIIRIADYSGRLSPPGKHFLTVTVLQLFMAEIFPHLSNTYKEFFINAFVLRK